MLGLARLDGTETVADIGCGNGADLSELSRRGHGGHVVGIDLSPGMLRSARAAAAKAILVLTSRAPVAAYLRSLIPVQELPDPDEAVAGTMQAIPFGPDGVFRARTHCGCLIAT